MKVQSAACLIRAMDLDAYLNRIAVKEQPDNDLVGLFALHRAHQLAIPFENLDVRLSRGIDLAPEAVFDKLVTRQRGGYCFEHNTLFADVLRDFGFEVRPLLARVWLSAADDSIPPRTHLLNIVCIGDEGWIVDVGFGASYIPPMRLEAGHEIKGPDGAFHRLQDHADFGWMLEFETPSGYRPAYSFTLENIAPCDIAQCNHWTSTWSGSRFIENVIVSICLPHGHASLFNRTYTRTKGEERVQSEITGNQMLQMRLSLMFGINLTAEEVTELALFA
jgi:N-hydroxyarylamine O-acetyltransferase